MPKGKCEVCGSDAYYGREKKSPVRCKDDRLPGMFDTRYPNCQKCIENRARYNEIGKTNPIYCCGCAKIVAPGKMVCTTTRKCKECHRTRCTFNFPTEKKGILCGTCAEIKHPGQMIEVETPKCPECNIRQMTFNFPEETKGILCGTCAEIKHPGKMIYVKHRKCDGCGEKKSLRFNFPGETLARYCKDCVETFPDLVDVVTTKCEKCHKKVPTFNYLGEKKGIVCGKCAKKYFRGKMENVKCPRCEECKETQPVFNFPKETKGILCQTCAHKKYPGKMVNVANNNCACKQGFPAKYRYLDEPDAKLVCRLCRIDGMINAFVPRCDECNTQAIYGVPSCRESACVHHKKPGMINPPNKKCEECTEPALFGIRTPTRCEKHAHSTDINLVEQICKNPECKRVDVVNAEGLCVNFCVPETEMTLYKKRVKFYEEQVFLFLNRQFPKLIRREYIPDTSCGRERTDFYLDCKTHVVCVEVDEKGYKHNTQECELTRMNNIFMAFGGMRVVFIRYNPHDFRDLTGTKQKVTEKERFDILKGWIQHTIDKEPQDFLSVLHLFFDGYDKNPQMYGLNPYATVKAHHCPTCDKNFPVKQLQEIHSKFCKKL